MNTQPDPLVQAQLAFDAAAAARDAALVAEIDGGATFYRAWKRLWEGCGREVITQPTVKAIYERTKGIGSKPKGSNQ